MDILRLFARTLRQPPLDTRLVPNTAGGYGFALDDVARLRRFLILGTDGGTYYVSARELTREVASVVLRLAETDHPTLLATILDVSGRGAAPKAQPALFALAVAASVGTDAERAAALAALPEVARTGTHLLTFAAYVEQFRGWVAGCAGRSPTGTPARRRMRSRTRR